MSCNRSPLMSNTSGALPGFNVLMTNFVSVHTKRVTAIDILPPRRRIFVICWRSFFGGIFIVSPSTKMVSTRIGSRNRSRRGVLNRNSRIASSACTPACDGFGSLAPKIFKPLPCTCSPFVIETSSSASSTGLLKRVESVSITLVRRIGCAREMAILTVTTTAARSTRQIPRTQNQIRERRRRGGSRIGPPGVCDGAADGAAKLYL